jgi:putative transposase
MDRRRSRKLTKDKRKNQTCKVFECKIDRSHLSNDVQGHLSKLFKEAKWFYNHCLALNAMDEIDTTVCSVPVKIGDEYEDRDLSVLQGQMKQSIRTRLWGSLASLAALKKKGFKVGKLKFKRRVNSIPLVQYNKTFFIKGNKVRIQGLKKWLLVNGLDQLPPEADIACATLVHKGKDYYINFTTFQDKEQKVITEASIGIDFGCETQMTFSNGVKVKWQVPPTKRLRRLDKKIAHNKNKPRSKKKSQDYAKRQKEYERLTNRKSDIRHKIVSAVKNNFRYVCFQDESIHAWHAGNHGKKIQFSGIGGIISDLKHKSHTPLEVEKFFPSTQLCPKCGTRKKLSLSERTYECDCGFGMDRDVKSAICAICIEIEGLKRVPMDHRDFKEQEISSSTFFNLLTNIDGVEVSKMKS